MENFHKTYITASQKLTGMFIFSMLLLGSCNFFSKKEYTCNTETLYKDTLLFSQRSKDILIDKSHCESFSDYAIYIKGRIVNNTGIEKNIKLLGIDNVDSLNNEEQVQLISLPSVKEWFNPLAIKDNNNYYHYYESINNTTKKWIFYRDGIECDTFYIALINY